MCNQINKILFLILLQFVILVGASNTKVIKSYSISKNFGAETRELSQSTIVRYNSKKQLLDSTLYIHNIPLSKKYSYCLLYTSPSPRDLSTSRMPSSA